MGAVIDERSLETQRAAIAEARSHPGTRVVAGGGVDDGVGWFVEPTVIETDDPGFRLLRDELFGPVVTCYVYPEGGFDDVLELVDRTAPYALTGAIFSEDRYATIQAQDALRYTAGNLYLNDKPTGAVVGQQPFGGGRASGTNDKAGSLWNLIRWVSPRTIKETFVPPTDYRYPFLGDPARHRPAPPHGAVSRAARLVQRRMDLPARPGRDPGHPLELRAARLRAAARPSRSGG